MRAIEFIGPRKIVLRDDAPVPEAKDGEVVIKCSHVALCGTNMGPYLYDGRWAAADIPRPLGWLGHENIGRIVQSRVKEWPEGTLVLADPEDRNGFMEYIVARPHGLARLPEDVPDLAAMIVAQPLATVLRAMARTGPVINQTCAVIGQGPMGLIFSHMLGRMGAARVIAVDRVGWRLRWARRFGATDVIDASQEDVVEAVRRLTGGADGRLLRRGGRPARGPHDGGPAAAPPGAAFRLRRPASRPAAVSLVVHRGQRSGNHQYDGPRVPRLLPDGDRHGRPGPRRSDRDGHPADALGAGGQGLRDVCRSRTRRGLPETDIVALRPRGARAPPLAASHSEDTE